MAVIARTRWWQVGWVALFLLVAESASAQAPQPQLEAAQSDGLHQRQPTPRSERQPTPQSVRQGEDTTAPPDRVETEADRKMREMDRRLSRTMRSVCTGC